MKKPRLMNPRKPAAVAPPPALPTVEITREQADILLTHQRAVEKAKAAALAEENLLSLAYRSVLAGHGVTQWSEAALATDAPTPRVVYVPVSGAKA
jgi:hypothetical protein